MKMIFPDIERKLRAFFRRESIAPNQASSTRIRRQILEKFIEEHRKIPFFERIFFFSTFRRLSPALAFASVVFLVWFNFFPGTSGEILAGTIFPKRGLVEIIRGEETIIVQSKTRLRVGDFIRIGNRAEAEIHFPDKFISTARDRTLLRVMDENALFLESGKLSNRSFKVGEIATGRGFVRSFPGSKFEISVSESGEAQIINSKNKIIVFDWDDGRAELSAGEEIKLRTDTSLVDSEVPGDLRLSLAQIAAIRAKLVIARTKIIAGITKAMAGENRDSERDFRSAEKTFRSIVQVLMASRNLEIVKRRNIAMVQRNEVFARMRKKTDNPELLIEIRALETLFDILQRNRGKFAFVIPKTGVETFDRFAIIDRVFQLGTEQEQKFSHALKQKYVVAFLNQIQDEPLKIDQISTMNSKITLLPNSKLAKEFLENLQSILPPDLAGILREKIEKTFHVAEFSGPEQKN